MPSEAHIVALWATSERYDQPQFVAAWASSLQEIYPAPALDLRRNAEEWFLTFGDDVDGPWRFFTTDSEAAMPPQDEVRSAEDREVQR